MRNVDENIKTVCNKNVEFTDYSISYRVSFRSESSRVLLYLLVITHRMIINIPSNAIPVLLDKVR